jgi:dynein heavy chain
MDLLFCLQPIAIAKIRKDFLTDPIFDLDHVRKAAWAAGKLCEWVMAIEAYDRMEKGSGGTVEVSK